MDSWCNPGRSYHLIPTMVLFHSCLIDGNVEVTFSFFSNAWQCMCQVRGHSISINTAAFHLMESYFIQSLVQPGVNASFSSVKESQLPLEFLSLTLTLSVTSFCCCRHWFSKSIPGNRITCSVNEINWNIFLLDIHSCAHSMHGNVWRCYI